MSLKTQKMLSKNYLIAAILLLVILFVGGYLALNEPDISPKIVENQDNRLEVAVPDLLPDESEIIKQEIVEEQASMTKLIEEQRAVQLELAQLNEQVQGLENDLALRKKELETLQKDNKQ